MGPKRCPVCLLHINKTSNYNSHIEAKNCSSRECDKCKTVFKNYRSYMKHVTNVQCDKSVRNINDPDYWPHKDSINDDLNDLNTMMINLLTNDKNYFMCKNKYYMMQSEWKEVTFDNLIGILAAISMRSISLIKWPAQCDYDIEYPLDKDAIHVELKKNYQYHKVTFRKIPLEKDMSLFTAKDYCRPAKYSIK